MDGIPTLNAYIDSLAISVGYAVQSGTVLQKNGNYWYRIGTTQAVDSSLTNRTVSTVVPIGTATKLNGNCNSSVNYATTGEYFSLSNCTYNLATGLYYDNGNSPRNWSSAYSLCIVKGMRLPSLSETTVQRSGGIPHFTSTTWTSTMNVDSNHVIWYGTNIYNYFDSSNDVHVRCVVSP